MQYNTRQDGIQVIARAAAILKTCRDSPEGLSLGEIALRAALPRSTVQRIVGALAKEGFLRAGSEAGSVRLGPALATFANGGEVNVVEAAHPHLKRLAAQTGETVDLAMLRRDHMVFIDQVAGSHRLRAVLAVGEKFPLHSTANGKAALALAGDGTKESAAIRRSGLAYDHDEHTKGICAIGAAFKDPAGRIYAISVPMPSIRFAKQKRSVAAALKRTVASLVRDLGVSP